MKKIKDGKISERFELTEPDIQTIRMMYMEDLHRTGVVGGPQMWFDVIVRFIESQGFEIKYRPICQFCKVDRPQKLCEHGFCRQCGCKQYCWID